MEQDASMVAFLLYAFGGSPSWVQSIVIQEVCAYSYVCVYACMCACVRARV